MAAGAEDSQIRRAVIERNLVTPDELAAADARRGGRNGAEAPLGQTLLELGYLTRTQLDRLVAGASDDSGSRSVQQIPGYQLIRKVGAGAMAVVYKAKQISLDRIVAIKVLPKRLSANTEFVDRFYKEGKAAAALSHNNIVQAIDVGEAGGFHYFVMEFVEGATVYDELAAGRLYEEKDALRIVRQIADALQHAHERGIIHRDVKPKNIMLTKERVAKLADMGLARATTDVDAALAEAGRAYGTPYYISPEQIRGEVSIDHRADIYSLGSTFYHMMTGKVPFEGPTPSAVMHKHLREALAPPDHLNTKLTAGCAAMIEMMMAKKREERYQSCRELIEDIDRLMRGEQLQYAQHGLDQSTLADLARGAPAPMAPPPRTTTDTSSTTIMLGVGLAVSIVLNIILIVVLMG
ncbi:MAG: serine/threonine protein kinase [Phycisphaerales bacterium]|nr:serine/threonine protein kinase [Phycisphaerales bacterium]